VALARDRGLTLSSTLRSAGIAVTVVLGAVGISVPPVSKPVQAQSAGGYDPMAPRRDGTGPKTDIPLNPEFDNLPDTPGVEDVYYTCSGCHSLAIIKQQRLTDARWDYTYKWMVEVQKMPEPDEETKRRILDYLKRHFSSE
jgi:hypothetical protein